MGIAHNIPIYKLLHALYDMQSKGYSFTDIRIEDDFNIVLRPSQVHQKKTSPPPPPSDFGPEEGDINIEDLV